MSDVMEVHPLGAEFCADRQTDKCRDGERERERDT